MDDANAHRPVLLAEVVDALQLKSSGVYVDATFGRGGHARAILDRLGPTGRLLVMDRDPEAIAAAEALATEDRRIDVERGSFAMIDRFVARRGLQERVDGVLLDLGVSSPQLDDVRRGFSFLRDGPLDMRMDPDSGIPAAAWLNRAPLDEIAQVLRDYGEERHAKRVARAIVKARASSPITTTGQLATIVAQANPSHERGKHPATRTFQAIRIFINRELEELAICLAKAVNVLAVGGRLVVISFHSLEDRIVKRFMRTEARGDEFPPDLPVTQAQVKPRLRIVGKPVYPCVAEVDRNPRSRSAVLRVAEKL